MNVAAPTAPPTMRNVTSWRARLALLRATVVGPLAQAPGRAVLSVTTGGEVQ